MEEYKYPIKFEDKHKTVLLLDRPFAEDDYLKYALSHNVDVLYTNTQSCDSVRVIYKFLSNGFGATFEEVQRTIGGIKLDPEVVVRLER